MTTTKVFLGNVITMDEKNPRAQAIVVKDGVIAAVGSKESIESFINDNTEMIDFGDSFIYPGLIDVHSHMGLMTTVMLTGLDFPYGDTYEHNIQALTEYIKNHPEKEIYTGHGFWVSQDAGFPTHQLLDDIVIDGKKFDKPVYLIDTGGHMGWMNKVAMEKYGVNREMVAKYGADQVICDDQGNPTGCVKETPHFAIMETLHVDLEPCKKLLETIQEMHLSHGYSMIGDCGIVEGGKPMVTAMSELAKEGKFKLKIRAYYQINECCPDPLAEVDKAVEYAKKYNCDNFKIIGIKIFLDGVHEGLSAWTVKPYKHYQFEGRPYYGCKRWDYDRLDEMAAIIKKANENGLSIEFHAIGSGAVKYGLDAIEKAQEGIKDPDFRNAISHIQYIEKEDLPRFAKLNIYPVAAPMWAIFDPNTLPAEKMIYGDPETDTDLDDNGYLELGVMRTLLDTGAKMVFHSDGYQYYKPGYIFFYGVKKYNPQYTQFTEPRNIKEHVTGYEAVKCMTATSAYVLGEEKNVGTIEAGKQADFIVYDVDFTDDRIYDDPGIFEIDPKALFINGESITIDGKQMENCGSTE